MYYADDVTRESVRAVLGGMSAQDEIGRERDQLEEAVNTIAAIEWMADDPDARREILEAIISRPQCFPRANEILDRFVDTAVFESHDWLRRSREASRQDYEESLAEEQKHLAAAHGWR